MIIFSCSGAMAARFFWLHLVLCLLLSGVECGLSKDFYSRTCWGLEYMVSSVVKAAVEDEPRMGASILRLHFHDCFVQGCDCSICLDDSDTITSEKNATPNQNSLRGFEVIERAKAMVEEYCPGIVSCADILALAAREAVLMLNGPYWEVLYGRRDSLTANITGANNELPGPNSTLAQLVQRFSEKGFSQAEMVTLSGAHTIGKAHCRFFRDRLFDFEGTGKPDPSLDSEFLSVMQDVCGRSNNSRFVPLDSESAEGFDDGYFKGVVSGRGLLRSDEEIGRTRRAYEYHVGQRDFFSDFGEAMVKMGSITPLTGSQGEIRRKCSFVNS